MEQLLSLLKTIPEYAAMVSSLQDGESVAVTGIGQINRSHMIAGLCRSLNRPMVVLCQDDLAARRLQEELKGFLADTAPILPGRDLTLYDAAVVSRSWEQKRLRQLYDLAAGKTGLQIMTWESLSLRTMPKAALLSAAFSLEVGREYAVEDLTLPSHRRRIQPLRHGGGAGSVRRPWRHSGHLLPRRRPACAGRILRRRAGHHGLL